MSEKTYRLIRLVLTIVVAVTVGIAVAYGNVIVPIIAVSLGMIVLFFSKRRVTEVVEDERAFLVSEKASRGALAIFGTIVAFLTPALVIMGQQGNSTLSTVGFTLGIGASFLMLLYWVFYGYYSRRYGSHRYAE